MYHFSAHFSSVPFWIFLPDSRILKKIFTYLLLNFNVFINFDMPSDKLNAYFNNIVCNPGWHPEPGNAIRRRVSDEWIYTLVCLPAYGSLALWLNTLNIILLVPISKYELYEARCYVLELQLLRTAYIMYIIYR